MFARLPLSTPSHTLVRTFAGTAALRVKGLTGLSSLFSEPRPGNEEPEKTVVYKKTKEQIKAAEPQVKVGTDDLETSYRKLGDLARQIQRKPIDHAIAQMDFSLKRHGPEIANLLRTARERLLKQHKNLQGQDLYVDAAWVGKGVERKKLWTKGRGRFALRVNHRAHMKVVVKSKITLDRVAEEKERKRLNKKVWVPLENKPLRARMPYYNF
ncbi:39S ribosomal protein L22, mitochondrial [Saitoella coloradoensis]